MTPPHRPFYIRVAWPAVAMAAFGTSLLATPPPPQLSEVQRVQVRQQATLQASQPARISVRALTQGTKAGDTSRLEISLRTPDDGAVPAPEDRILDVSLTLPSGKVSTQQVTIAKGEASTQFDFVANEPGLTSVRVRARASGLLPSGTEALVVPAAPARRLRRPATPPGAAALPYDRSAPRFALTRFELAPAPPAQGPSGLPSGLPVLHISANNAGSDFFANGKNAATISAYFESPDGAPAPADIHIWFTWTNGELNPRPLQIDRGKFSADAHLTSVWPALVHVRFVSASPSYDVQGDKEFDIRFVPPAIALLGPEKLSVVDNEPILVVFCNEQGMPLPIGSDREVTLRSTRSKLRFVPGLFEVKHDTTLGSASLFPTWFGSDTVEAIVSDYQPKPLTIVVTGWLVLGLCVTGGFVGGLAAFYKSRGSFLARILLGILGGAILSWLYVYLALPKLDAAIAHNTFSVLFVSIVGGYLGIATLDFAASKLGLKPPADQPR